MQQDSSVVGAEATFISYAQNSEDVVLWRALRHIRDGRYVDVGACDPVEYSVTKAFYDRGWSGINVEPVQGFAERLREIRPRDLTYQVAAGAADGKATLHVARHTGLSTLVDERVAAMVDRGFLVEDTEVEVRRLDDIIGESPLAGSDIHFLKIDVEGAEGAVLAGLDLTSVRPWVIMVESTELLSPAEVGSEWKSLILSQRYTHALFDGLNSVYLAEEHLELLPLLSYPAGVHDQPYISSQAPAVREFVEQHEQAAQDRARKEKESQAAEIDRLLHVVEDNKATIERLTKDHQVLEGVVRTTETALNQAVSQHRAWRSEIVELEATLGQLQIERAQILHTHLKNSAEHESLRQIVEEFEHTVSWRVTKPLRAAKRMSRKAAESVVPERTSATGSPEPIDETSPLYRGVLARLRQVAILIEPNTASDTTIEDPLELISACLANTRLEPTTSAWLVLVAAGAAYPNDSEVARAARTLRLDGPDELFELARHFFAECCRLGRATEKPLEIVTNSVLVDVSHTAAHSLHTGIQRVVRETVSRWLDTHGETRLFHWDFTANSPRLLAASEVERFANWRNHLDGASDDRPRDIEDDSGRVVVPWRSTLVIPELAAEPDRCNAYRTMKSAGICSLSMIVYDMIPFTAPETVGDGMPGMFSNAVTVAKVADRLSAISRASAAEYSAFCSMLLQQGLPGPIVEAHSLPSASTEVTEDDLNSTRARLGIDLTPLVLVVGSHEPRKNHVAVLESAETLWREGLQFQLVFVGGSGWKAGDFDEFSLRLQNAGRDLQIIKKASETQVWSLYRLADFTVFPSLVEGFGLPIAESLVCGTPAITSAHGSMLEVAEGGGTMLVDPRVPSEIADAMRHLLTDPAKLAELRAQAAGRQWQSWESYAGDLWLHLVGELPDRP